MNIDINVYLHSDGDASMMRKLSDLIAVVTKLERKMASILDEVIAKVSEQTTVLTSSVAAWDGLKAKLDELIDQGNNDPKLIALRDAVAANTQLAADATVRNTIAEDEEPAPV